MRDKYRKQHSHFQACQCSSQCRNGTPVDLDRLRRDSEGTSSYTGNKNPTSSPSSSRYLGVICPSPQVFHGELYWQLEMTVLLPGLVDCLQDPLQNKKLIASAGILNPYELPVQRWNTFR